MKKALFITVLISLLSLISLQAQEIETLWDIEVTTASKSVEKLSDAPGIISVVSKEEIAGFGYTTLSDILNRVTSMYMIHAGTFMWNVGSIRGQNISNSDNHVLILINGRPFRDGMSGGFNNITYAAFPVNVIDHIEIIRGPGSVLYGTNAYSGVINLITETSDNEHTIVASSTYGSFNTKNIAANGGITISDEMNINFGINYYDDDGPEFKFMDTPFQIPTADGILNIPSNNGKGRFTKDNKSAFLNINYKGLHFNTLYADLNPFGLVLPFKWEMNANPPYKAGEEMVMFKKYFADLGYNISLNDNYSLDFNLTYNWFKAEGWVQDDNNPNATKGLTYNPMFEMVLNASPVENLNLVAGGLVDYNSFEGAQMTEGSLLKYNMYIQADYRIKKVKLILGSQFNKIEKLEPNFSPRVGIITNLNNNWGIKLLYSSALRNAYPIETHVNHPSFTGNLNLNPELISTAEAQIFFQNETTQTSITYFNSHLTQLINRRPNINEPGKFIYQNIGSFDFSGVEFEGKFKLTDKLKLLASACYQENKKDDSIKNAAYWPKVIAKAGILYNSKIISFGVWHNYFGKPTLIPNPIINNNPEPASFNQLSANITINISDLIKEKMKPAILLSFYGDNLLNKSATWFPEFSLETVNSLPIHAGRSFFGKLILKL